MPSAPRPAPSPLDDTDRMVVDGTNLLYRLGRGSAAPPAAAIGRLRAVVPATITIDLVFDGMGHGVTGRVAQGMHVRYSGRRPGDEVILDLAAGDQDGARGGRAATARVLVVTDDRDLRTRLLALGVRSVPLAWLTNRLDMPRLSSPASGNRRATLGAGTPAGTAPGGATGSSPGTPAGEDDDRPRWKPGRGATAKTGPAHKVARHKRHPRQGG
jgi:rRNA-processing protein FCF1